MNNYQKEQKEMNPALGGFIFALIILILSLVL